MDYSIPQDKVDFLYWFKDQTESKWQEEELKNNESLNWLYSGKWQGLDEKYISEIESKFNVEFSEEHKLFLKILHCVDKKRPVEYYNDQNELEIRNEPYFYNWLKDEKEISFRQSWPYNQIFKDIKNGYWLKEWGTRPSTVTELEIFFSEWYKNAPKLIPIFGHRFVVSNWKDQNNKSPVISVWGSDTIIYGWGIKHYLISELGHYLDITEQVYDQECNTWNSEYNTEAKEYMENSQKIIKDIPYWKEIINAN